MGDYRRLGIAAIAVLVLSAGCATSQDANTTPPTPTRTNLELINADVWSADPGVDLFSRGAELVRATVESGDLTLFGGISAAFPGYSSAFDVPHDASNYDIETTFYSDSKTLPQQRRTEYLHITSYAADSKRVSAVVCRFYTRPESIPGEENSAHTFCEGVVLENGGVDAGKPGLRDEAAETGTPNGSRVPAWNVFGTWKIKKIKLLGGDETPDSCFTWWGEKFPYLTRVGSRRFYEVVPGATMPTAPLATSYPEWIGPS
ncbi:hypothetical protein [Nocardia pseudovaccinii]|uniref:hypothetical protein n=1 Tax=Nocardia pseudovaccinii TaxID=189540 RepID=UPI0012F5051C|nr:hypothetical protein [Nocardia pseudovaccinii]